MSSAFLKVLCCLLLIALISCSKENSNSTLKNGKSKTNYALLADSLGADEHGMKVYTFCTLVPGKPTIMSETEFNETEQQHFAYMKKLAQEGHILMAGSFLDKKEEAGFLVFNNDSIEAKKLLEKDVKFQKGILTAKFNFWYGPAALHNLHKVHKRLINDK